MIRLYKDYQGIVGAYSPFIIRPPDSKQVPRDISYQQKCSWPCYAGSNFQQWCSEENSSEYYAMRPLVRPDEYNQWLSKLFNIMIDTNYRRPDKIEWSFIFCQTEAKKDLQDYIKNNIAKAVVKIPEMQHNGSWKREEFHVTDLDVYQFVDSSSNLYYNLIFNLYNALRSVSTLVEMTLLFHGNSFRIVI